MTHMSGCCGRGAAVCMVVFWISDAFAGETWVSTGVGGSGDTLYSYGGVTFAPGGSLNDEGLRTRLWGKAHRFNDGVKPSSNPATDVQISGTGAEAELGWQFVGPAWRSAVYAGGVWRDDAMRGSRLGMNLAAEASYELSARWRLIGDVKYTFRFDEVWAQLRPEFEYDDGLYLGLVSSASKGPGYSIVRGGASLGGLSYAVPWMGDVYVSIEAGAEYNITMKNNGPYAALHIGFAY